MVRGFLWVWLLFIFSLIGAAQSLTVPAKTALSVQIHDHLPMRVGQPIIGQLVYPIFVDNTEVLPAHTVVLGKIVALKEDHSHRIDARLRADFTPFRIPIVRFDSITLANGLRVPITTGQATDGAPLYRLIPPSPRKGGFIRQQWDNCMGILHDKLAIITGPDKRDRFVQLLYSQLPYHPQRIAKDTAWTVETSEPVSVDMRSSSAAVAAADTPSSNAAPAQVWIIQADLDEPLDSDLSKTGQDVQATVLEPVFNPDHTIAVPQGARLTGTVSLAKQSRSFGRAGKLRFDFHQIILPGEKPQNVQAALMGADSSASQNLALDSEGHVQPKPKDKLLVPLVLFALASRPLDSDGDGSSFARNGVASNSLGLLGFILGTAAGKPNLAAGLGYYGTAISVYERWIKHGSKVSFAQHTRIVLQTVPRNSNVLRPAQP